MDSKDRDFYGKSYQGTDSGCQIASEVSGRRVYCLECPLENCIEDETRQNKTSSLRKHKRDEGMMLLLKQGKTLGQVASQFGVSCRTVYRISGRWQKNERSNND